MHCDPPLEPYYLPACSPERIFRLPYYYLVNPNAGSMGCDVDPVVSKDSMGRETEI